MIGKMADEKEIEEKAARSESEEEEEEEEEVINGEGDSDNYDSEYDDPDGFVDDITDEGN